MAVAFLAKIKIIDRVTFLIFGCFLTGKGARGSVGSRGSRRLTGRGSVGFALAPLDEVESMRIEVVSCPIQKGEKRKAKRVLAYWQ